MHTPYLSQVLAVVRAPADVSHETHRLAGEELRMLLDIVAAALALEAQDEAYMNDDPTGNDAHEERQRLIVNLLTAVQRFRKDRGL